MKYTCPCCGYKTLDDPATGIFYICELCGWEDDLVQKEDPDYEGGANGICLREAQHEFINGDIDADGYSKDFNWQLLEPPSKESRLKNSKTTFIANSNGEVKRAQPQKVGKPEDDILPSARRNQKTTPPTRKDKPTN